MGANKPTMRIVIALVVPMACSHGARAGSFIYDSQERQVAVEAWAMDWLFYNEDSCADSDETDPGDFGPFSAGLACAAVTMASWGEAHADHASTLGESLITATGSGSATAYYGPDGDSSGGGDSSLRVSFHVVDSTPVRLDGELDATVSASWGSAGASVTLKENGTTVFTRTVSLSADAPAYLLFSYEHALIPGNDYELRVAGHQWAAGGGATMSYDVSLAVVPEPAALSLVALGGLAVLRRRRR